MGAVVVSRRARGLVAATALACLLVGCGGGGQGDDGGEGGEGGEGGARAEVRPLPLPKDVALTGAITEPALKPRWLVESTGTEESTDYENVEARSGTIVLDEVVVTYGRDNLTAIDRETGKTAWTSDLDMRGGTICDITEPTTPDIEFLTLTFGDEDFCTEVGRIATDDGREVYVTDDGPAGDRRVGMATYDNTSYVVGSEGLVTRYAGDSDGSGSPVKRLGGRVLVRSVAPVQEPALLVVQSTVPTDQDRIVLTALSVPDLEVVWRREAAEILPRLRTESTYLVATDGRFLFVQHKPSRTYNLVELDPATGEEVGRRVYDTTVDPSTGEVDTLGVDLPNLANDPNQLVLVGDDAILSNGARGLSRVARDGTIRWTFRTTGLTLREGEDAFIGNGPLSADGKQVLATLHNGRSTDLLALDVESGTLVGRWAVPEQYVAGFTASPYVTLVDDGVVLTRNLTLFGDTEGLNDGPDRRTPFDVGYFAFPDP